MTYSNHEPVAAVAIRNHRAYQICCDLDHITSNPVAKIGPATGSDLYLGAAFDGSRLGKLYAEAILVIWIRRVCKNTVGGSLDGRNDPPFKAVRAILIAAAASETPSPHLGVSNI
jgi:hypothetical protein